MAGRHQRRPGLWKNDSWIVITFIMAVFSTLLAIVFFGVSTVNKQLIYIGIAASCFAFACMIYMMVRLHALRRGRDMKTTCCHFCCFCCPCCCKHVPRDSRLNVHDIAMQRHLASRGRLQNLRAEHITQLRATEAQIVQLVEMLSRLETQENQNQINNETREFAELLGWYLQTENQTLSRWLEGGATCTTSEIDRMQRRIGHMIAQVAASDPVTLQNMMAFPNVQTWARRSRRYRQSQRQNRRSSGSHNTQVSPPAFPHSDNMSPTVSVHSSHDQTMSTGIQTPACSTASVYVPQETPFIDNEGLPNPPPYTVEDIAPEATQAYTNEETRLSQSAVSLPSISSRISLRPSEEPPPYGVVHVPSTPGYNADIVIMPHGTAVGGNDDPPTYEEASSSLV